MLVVFIRWTALLRLHVTSTLWKTINDSPCQEYQQMSRETSLPGKVRGVLCKKSKNIHSMLCFYFYFPNFPIILTPDISPNPALPSLGCCHQRVRSRTSNGNQSEHDAPTNQIIERINWPIRKCHKVTQHSFIIKDRIYIQASLISFYLLSHLVLHVFNNESDSFLYYSIDPYLYIMSPY